MLVTMHLRHEVFWNQNHPVKPNHRISAQYWDCCLISMLCLFTKRRFPLNWIATENWKIAGLYNSVLTDVPYVGNMLKLTDHAQFAENVFITCQVTVATRAGMEAVREVSDSFVSCHLVLSTLSVCFVSSAWNPCMTNFISLPSWKCRFVNGDKWEFCRCCCGRVKHLGMCFSS